MTDNDQWNDAQDSTAPDSDEWNDVAGEVQMNVEAINDGFTGRLIAIDPPNANGIIQAHFTDVNDINSALYLEAAFMNLTRDLVNKLRKVPLKSMVRIQWVSVLNTGHESGTPMRVFDVKWRR